MLTFVYEEALGWNIAQNSIDELKTFHVEGLKSYLKRGVEIKRLDSKLLKLDITKIADALNPADLDFDYLGIQTSTIVILSLIRPEKNLKRLETPQLFWMRVAMGSSLMKITQKIKSYLYTTYIKAVDSAHPHLHCLIREHHIHSYLPATYIKLMILSNRLCTGNLLKMHSFQSGLAVLVGAGLRFVEPEVILPEQMEKARESFLS